MSSDDRTTPPSNADAPRLPSIARYAVKKNVLGVQSVKFECPNTRCRSGLSTSLFDAGQSDQCPDCGIAFIAPGVPERRDAEHLAAKRKSEKEQAKEERAAQRRAYDEEKIMRSEESERQRAAEEEVERKASDRPDDEPLAITPKFSSPSSKSCPYCLATVPQAAQKCQHCGEWLVRRHTPVAEPPRQKTHGCTALIAIAAFVVFAFFIYSVLASPDAGSPLKHRQKSASTPVSTAEIISATLHPVGEIQEVLTTWKNTGSTTIRGLNARISTFDESGRTIDSFTYWIYAAESGQSGVTPGSTCSETAGDGHLLTDEAIPGSPKAVSVRVRVISVRG